MQLSVGDLVCHNRTLGHWGKKNKKKYLPHSSHSCLNIAQSTAKDLKGMASVNLMLLNILMLF